MISVVQRVSSGACVIDSQSVTGIGPGLVVLICVCHGDTEDDAQWMARKIANLRVFNDLQEKLNCSVLDARGQVLLVPQFTLCGDCRKGYRPSFSDAAGHAAAKRLFSRVGELLDEYGLATAKGVFGAYMQIKLANEGPVTLVLDSKRIERYEEGSEFRERAQTSGGKNHA